MNSNGGQEQSVSSGVDESDYKKFIDAVTRGDNGEAYKAAIRMAAGIRGTMTQAERRRASVELILEADEEPKDDAHLQN